MLTRDESILETYYELHRNDYGYRPRMAGVTVAAAQAWLDARPDRPTGYGCPEAYARECAELAEAEAAYKAEGEAWAAAREAEAAEAAEAARFNVWDFDVSPAGRVDFHAH
ncbi:hypothetical protein MARCHEWKA_01060 [Brevundimonas phage vB_BpoS-Marchewka]|uniref:Uncharacterized protein n=1 Tax=Brevundimonas phage vB_BpoS-Marchewka TaxID=2948604 RepID=A0A9E7N5B1_9CAUD|nr:hypothetical protein MARCHEWKA_01060 [Brevundimonas phage vB_BpoS-Marchewka]